MNNIPVSEIWCVTGSQRVVVLRDRRKVGELAGAEISEQAIMGRMAAPAECGAEGEGGHG